MFFSMTLILVSFFPLSAQDGAAGSADTVSTTISEVRPLMSHNVFWEIFGPSFGVGVGFDSRFRSGSVFGYRVGLSWTNGSSSSDYDGRDVDFNGVCVPLELNAVFGKQKSKFEVGLGVTPAILRRTDTHRYWVDETDDNWLRYDTTRGTKLNVLGTINVGYRYQREEGFFMRIGLTAYIGDFDCSPIDGVIFLPGLSLGYTFKY